MAIFTPELLEKLKLAYNFWPVYFVFVFIYVVITYFLSLKQLRRTLDWIKGPQRQLFLGNSLNFIGHSWSDNWKTINQWLEKYDGLVQVWIFHNPTVLIARGDIIEKLLKGTKDTLMRKSQQYRFMKSFFGGGLLIKNSVEWNNRRKLLNPFFDQNKMQDFVPSICHHARALVIHLKEKAKKTEIIDFQHYSQMSTLDVNLETLMKASPNFQDSENKSYIKAVKTATDITKKRTLTPFYNWNIVYLFTLTKLLELKTARTISNFTKKIIEKKRKTRQVEKSVQNGEIKKTPSNLLDFLLDHQDKNKLTQADVQQEVNNFLFTGNETLSSGIAFTLYLIGRHPEIQERLVKEIKTVIPGLSSEEEPTTSQLDKLEFLGLCIKESLRLYPPVPWIGRELKNSIKIDDSCKFPENINIAISIYHLHRSKKYYKNPNEFDPNRFLNAPNDDADNYTYMPFGAGWRSCIGRKFAILEMKIIISHILSEYSVTSIDRPEDLDITGNVILRSNNGLRVRLNSRNKHI